jgi:hypothetical protein
MKQKYVSHILFILLTVNSFGQEKIIRIGPGPLQKKPEPVVILDGIIIPSGSIEHVLVDNKDLIDSVSIQQDSIFDCSGKLVNLGIVRIYSRDSINSGAKLILKLTDNFIYQHPLTKLIINKIHIAWDENTYYKLANLKTDDIIYAKVKESKKNKCDKTLKLKINE